MSSLLASVAQALRAENHAVVTTDSLVRIEGDTWILSMTTIEDAQAPALQATMLWKNNVPMNDSARIVDVIAAWNDSGWEAPTAAYHTDLQPGFISVLGVARLSPEACADPEQLVIFLHAIVRGSQRLSAALNASTADAAAAVPPAPAGRHATSAAADTRLHAIAAGIPHVGVRPLPGSVFVAPFEIELRTEENSPWCTVSTRWASGLPVDNNDLLIMAVHQCNAATLTTGVHVDFRTTPQEIILTARCHVLTPDTAHDATIAATLSDVFQRLSNAIAQTCELLDAPRRPAS